MKVYLVRHAIAHERSRARWPNDAMRPLTAAGKQRFRKAARGLARLLPKSALLLTSPFVRARDTALILARVAKLRSPVKAPELASGKPAREAFELLRSRKKAAIVLVGHEPGMSGIGALLVGGADFEALGKAEAARIHEGALRWRCAWNAEAPTR